MEESHLIATKSMVKHTMSNGYTLFNKEINL
jgi:hypothetical protein